MREGGREERRTYTHIHEGREGGREGELTPSQALVATAKAMLVSSFCMVKMEGKVLAASTSFKGFS